MRNLEKKTIPGSTTKKCSGGRGAEGRGRELTGEAA